MMRRGKHNQTPHQTRSEDSPRPGTSQAEAPPSNKKSSTMSPGQRIRVSVLLLSVSEGHISDHLAQRAVMWIGDDGPSVRSFVYPSMNIVTDRSSQKEATRKSPPSGEQPQSEEQPKATAKSEAEPTNPPDDAKRESSGAQRNVEVITYLTR